MVMMMLGLGLEIVGLSSLCLDVRARPHDGGALSCFVRSVAGRATGSRVTTAGGSGVPKGAPGWFGRRIGALPGDG